MHTSTSVLKQTKVVTVKEVLRLFEDRWGIYYPCVIYEQLIYHSFLTPL